MLRDDDYVLDEMYFDNDDDDDDDSYETDDGDDCWRKYGGSFPIGNCGGKVE